MNRYALRTGEYLAISSDAIRRDADGFFLMLGGESPDNETRGSVVLVNVRGALQQFASPFGDSYESIEARVSMAFAAEPKPSAVVLRISSPGGVVAGLNECVMKLQRMSKAAGIPLVAYIDEVAASAAFALCCACSEVLIPPSGIAGSVGVISTMVSVVKADEKQGIEFRIITSGEHKADGHIHAPFTDKAVKAETARNAELAAQFFALAGKARGIAPKALANLQAAIYLGKEAKRVGLVDDVIGLDDMLLGLDTAEVPATSEPAPNEGNTTDRRARELKVAQSGKERASQSSNAPRSDDMAIKLDALIKKTEAAIATETDAKKIRALQATLAAYAATRADMDGDDDGDEPPPKKKDGDGDDDDESKAKKAAAVAKKAKAHAEASKHRAKAAEHKQKAAESEEEAKRCEEEAEGGDEEEEEARLRTPTPVALTPGAAAAIASQGEIGREALARIEKLEKSAATRELNAMIEEARAARRITPGEAKTLATKSASFVKDFLGMRPKALVATTEEDLDEPSGTPAGDIPPAAKAMVEQGIEALGLTGKKADEYREASYAAHRKSMSSNGAGAY